MNYKKDFPIFENNPDLIYLDSAATSQKPIQVIEAMKNFQEKENSNIQRGLYDLAENASNKFNKAREKVAQFINAKTKEIIFTKNTTESLNLLSYTLDSIIPEDKDEIVLTEMEHHSNLIHWQQLAKRKNMKIKFIKMKDDFTLDYNDAQEKINEKTAIVAFTHISNVLGTINDSKKLCELANKVNAFSIIDSAQGIIHTKINVKEMNCSFLSFSSHKMFGPTGIGVLYGKQELLEKLPPFLFGGGIVKKVTKKDAEFLDSPEKFEAGTQSITESIGLLEAINYIENIGIENIQNYIKELTTYSIDKLKQIKNIEIYSPENNSSGIISFNIKGIHSHDLASILNDDKIAIRAGHHCAMPLMEILKVPGTARISLQIYNNQEDIDKLIESLKKIKNLFEND